jgi:hypothetical protein
MRLVRSWPARVPEGRPHVVDGMERLIIEDFDYRPLADLDDDVLLIEWDIAAGREEIEHFAEHAYREPKRVLTAPYKLYRDSGYRPHWPEPDNPWVWMLNHWRGEGERPDAAQGETIPGSHTVMPDIGDPTCNGFGFGMIYLPRKLIRRFVKTDPSHFGDVSFSVWHFHNVRPDARICWHVRPVHLHADVPSVPERQ